MHSVIMVLMVTTTVPSAEKNRRVPHLTARMAADAVTADAPVSAVLMAVRQVMADHHQAIAVPR